MMATTTPGHGAGAPSACMEATELIAIESRLGAHHYKPFDGVLQRGEGVWTPFASRHRSSFAREEVDWACEILDTALA